MPLAAGRAVLGWLAGVLVGLFAGLDGGQPLRHRPAPWSSAERSARWATVCSGLPARCPAEVSCLGGAPAGDLVALGGAGPPVPDTEQWGQNGSEPVAAGEPADRGGQQQVDQGREGQ